MKRLFFSLSILIICICGSYAQMSTSIPPDQPKLVVGIVVEQMRPDYLERFWDKFSNNGFKRISNNGCTFKNAHFNYSLTQTTPGFVTIVSGTEPSAHGIVSDYWFVPLTGERESAIENKKYKAIGENDAIANYSPEKIFSTSFSDEAKLFYRGNSKVFSIGLSPAGSVLSGGYAADAAFWFDTQSGKWISSSYYIKDLPNWVKEFNNRKTHERFLERKWEMMLESNEYTAVLPDSNRYEFGIYGTFKTFPYDYQEINKYLRDYELIMSIPEGNTLTTDFAIATLLSENLGNNDNTDFLFVHYHVTENIGNLYGPQSVELMDTYLQLDKNIAHLVSVLEDNLGRNNFILYLTSNCGVSEVPQYLIDNKLPGGYFRQHYIKALLNSYLKAIYGEGDWILDFGNNQIFLNKTLIEDSQISVKDFQNTVADFIINSGGISNVLTGYNLQNNIFFSGIPKKMQNSFNPKRSGDIMISLNPGWIEDMTNVVAHNSGYSYDTHVPLIWYGWKVKRQTVYDEVNISNIAPTVSMILNTPKPPLCTGKPMPFVFQNK
jgi:hypothetical protein